MTAEGKNNQKYRETGPQRGYTKVHLSTWKIMLNNFLGGLAWGFGTILGATVVVALVILLLTKLNSLPFIGDFFSDILNTINTK